MIRIFVAVAFAVLFAACAEKQVFLMSDYQKLRTDIDAAQESIPWSQAILPDGVASKDVVKPVASVPGMLPAYPCKKIYPTLIGFGSLDISELPSEVVDLLDGFFASAITPEPQMRMINQIFLNTKYSFLPYILRHHFAEMPKIENLAYGKPEILSDGYQIPVRFVFEKSHIDANVFVSSVGVSYLIDQIQFNAEVGD